MYFLAKYNTQTDFYFPMVKRAVVDLAVTGDWTPATGDTKIGKDGAANANTTNNPAIASGVSWKLTVTATELSAKWITIAIVDSATKAVEDQFLNILTYGNASAFFPAPDYQDAVRFGLTALPNAAAEAAGGFYTRGTGAGQIKQTNNGEIDSNITHINNVVTTPVTTIKAVQGLTTADTITTYTGDTPQTGDCYPKVDTEVATLVTGVADIQGRLPAALTTGGNIKAGIQGFLDSVFTEGAVGRIAAAFKQFFNIASPAATMDHSILVDTVTTYTGNTPQTGDAFARLGTPAGASVSVDVAAIKAVDDAIKTKTDALPAAPASTTNITSATGVALGTNGFGSGAITAAAGNVLADALLDRNMATGTDSGTDSTAVRTPRQALRALRNKNSISGGTQTVTKEDDSTVSHTAAVTTTAGNPISAVDPT